MRGVQRAHHGHRPLRHADEHAVAWVQALAGAAVKRAVGLGTAVNWDLQRDPGQAVSTRRKGGRESRSSRRLYMGKKQVLLQHFQHRNVQLRENIWCQN